MDWQARFYPLDVFHSLEKNIVSLIHAETFQAVQIVREEIDSIGTPDLKSWARNHAGAVVPMSETIQKEGAAIEAAYPDLTDPKSTFQSADAYVIALAKLTNSIVVSQETSANEKRNPKMAHYIPDVCRDLGIPCINILGLMRREKWIF